VVLAVKAGAIAIPFALVWTRTVRRPWGCVGRFPVSAAWFRAGGWAAKRPLAPRLGAVKVTVAAGTGLPSASVTVTASGIGKRLPAGVD
jgi:hypothetical protein